MVIEAEAGLMHMLVCCSRVLACDSITSFAAPANLMDYHARWALRSQTS